MRGRLKHKLVPIIPRGKLPILLQMCDRDKLRSLSKDQSHILRGKYGGRLTI